MEPEMLPETQRATWDERDVQRTTRRRRRIARTHGHAATPYPVEGCDHCAPRVVRRAY